MIYRHEMRDIDGLDTFSTIRFMPRAGLRQDRQTQPSDHCGMRPRHLAVERNAWLRRVAEDETFLHG
ncbi:hypothetical protein X739_28245 [Mesorhizobium sp. LNHC220B00]|nr:hypothetical protein [Mesorhizobium sp. LNHC220B00]ESY81100.1 hypothetical protein X739_28245 [Mesorhizobium sp. LNHC220B00]